MENVDRYMLGYRLEEQARLQAQARQLASESRWLFEQVPLPEGARALEIGCGPHGCLEILSRRVGPFGTVVGIERNEDAVRLATDLVQSLNLENVEVHLLDGRNTELPRASFDLVTARLVLVNVPNPAQILKEAADLLKPGGWMALHEADYVSFLCDPPCEAWTEFLGLFFLYAERNGIDPFIGRKLPRLMRDIAGLEQISVRPIIHLYPLMHERRFLAVDFAENMAERFVESGLIEVSDVTTMIGELRSHLEDPDTLVVSHLFLQGWGKKAAPHNA